MKQNNFQAMNGPTRGTGWFRVQAADASGPATVEIYDRIGKDWWSGEGTDAKSFCEILKTIPMQQEIVLRINSPGGNVHDGMTIYNRLAERREHVKVVVDGVAASIASVIALCGRELEMPRNSLMMIHDPWGYVEGNAEELRKAADMLDKHRDAIVSVYERKTGKSAKELQKMMSDETWFTGDDAKEHKFADLVTDEISFQACFDYSRYQRVPEQLRAVNNEKKENDMDKAKIIAELTKLGVKHDASASVEVLSALLANAKAAAEATTTTTATSAVTTVNATVEEDEDTDEPPALPKRSTKLKAKSVTTDSPSDEISKLRGEVANVTAHLERERKTRIEREVDAVIAEDKVPAAHKAKWVARALNDESVLDDLRALPAKPPGGEPLALSITSEAPKDIADGIVKMRAPVISFCRGNSVNPEDMASASRQIAVEIAKNRKRLDTILNTNTVAPELKRNVILQDFMRAFKRRLVQLNVFSTTFRNVPLIGTDKVSVPYYELDTTTSANFVAATGYEFTHDTTTGQREVTINKRKYKPLTFSSSELARQPYFRPPVNMMLMAEQLAVDVWLDVCSIVTIDPYGVAVFDAEAGAMDVDDIITIRKACQDADWPEVGRALVLGTSHEAALLADETVKHYFNIGSTEPIREGASGRLLGFEMFYSPRIPLNSEDLGGFACLPSAALVVTSPVAPAPGVRSRLISYDIVTDPDTGMAFEYRYWGEAQMDKDREIVECNYGYAKGNASALKRVQLGTSQWSSSSSLSSVNSSSSSSSSA